MAEIEYDANTLVWNGFRAARDRPGKNYARVYVDVIAVRGDQVTLRVPPEVSQSAPDTQPKEITVVWNKDDPNIWMEYPSTLISNQGWPPGPPAEGQSGYLYLESAFLSANGIAGDPKWPNNLPGADVRRLRIFPTKIEITGHELATGRQKKATIDLLDENLASLLQIVELDVGSRRVELLLTETAFNRFLVPFPKEAPTPMAAPPAEIEPSARRPADDDVELSLTLELPQGGTVKASATKALRRPAGS